MIADRLAGMSPEATVEHVWKAFVRPRPRVYPRQPLMGGGLVRFAPSRLIGRAVPRDYVLTTSTPRGERTYRIFHEFLFPAGERSAVVDRGRVVKLVERLNAY